MRVRRRVTNDIVLVLASACAALLVAGCSPSSSEPDTIVLGEQVTAGDPTSPATTDNTATIDSISVTGSLTLGQPSTITLSCTVSDPDGTIQSVAADFSAIGGPKGVMLKASGKVWIWSGIVTASIAGSGLIVFTASDDMSVVATQTTSVVVPSDAPGTLTTANQPPTVSGLTITGDLIEGQSCSVTISCTTSDPDGTVESVTVNLTQIGGPASQTLTNNGIWMAGDNTVVPNGSTTGSGGQWTWSGTVTPGVTGSRTIVVSATDDKLAVATAAANVVVAEQGLLVTNPAISNRLVQGRACSITLSCNVSISNGTVQSVTADLSSIGQSAPQVLTLEPASGKWTSTVLVTAPAIGAKTITFTATDGAGITATGSCEAGVLDPQVLYTDWLLIMAGMPSDAQGNRLPFDTYKDALIQGILTTHIRVVLLNAAIWDWSTGLRYDPGTSQSISLDHGMLSEAEVRDLVNTLRSNGITVAFHCADSGLRTIPCDRVWLLGDSTHWGAKQKLQALGAKVAYADGYIWSDMDFYMSTLRNVIGTDGVLLMGDGNRTKYIDGYSTVDQGDPVHTYCFAHPRQYADWLIASMGEYQRCEPSWWRFEVGWIGESMGFASTPARGVTLWPSPDYEYVWNRVHEAGYALSYRTTVESLIRRDGQQPDQRLQLIGTLEQNPSTPAVADESPTSVAMSSDGTKLVAAGYGGRLYTSIDSGQTWTQRQPAGDTNQRWNSVAMSSDGSRILACVWNGRLYMSTNSGTTWNERGPLNSQQNHQDLYWEGLAISANGTRMVARVSNYYSYASTDSGVTWPAIDSPSQVQNTSFDWHDYKGWGSVAMSQDGMTVATTYRDTICTSNNSGASWTPRSLPGNGCSKSCVAISADGAKIVAGSWPGRLWLSSNSGVSWTEQYPAGDAGQFWQCAAMSSDGLRVIVGAWPGRLYIGTCSGQVWAWTQTRPSGDVNRYWESVAISADGTRLIAADRNGVYTSSNSGATWTVR